MKLNWKFLGGGGVQNKKPSMGEYGYFLELHIEQYKNPTTELLEIRHKK